MNTCRTRVAFVFPCALALLLSGCFYEIRGGYYPALKSELRDDSGNVTEKSTSGAFVVGLVLGVWLDFFGVGVGVTTDAGSGTSIIGDDTLGSGLQMTSSDLRIDLDIPIKNVWLDGYVRPRITYGKQWMTGAEFTGTDAGSLSDESTGSGHYLGFTLSAPGGLYSLSAGPSFWNFKDTSGAVSRLDASASSVSVSGVGAELRFAARIAMPGILAKWRSSSASPQVSTSCTNHVTTSCEYGLLGYRCVESSNCY